MRSRVVLCGVVVMVCRVLVVAARGVVRRLWLGVLPVLVVGGGLWLADSAWAGTVTVTNTSDSGPGSLRAAIGAASPGDTITFDPSLHGQTITLSSGALAITQALTIQGPGAGLLAVSAAGSSRIFTITGSGDVSISGLTLSGGSDPLSGGAIEDTGSGSLSVVSDTFSHDTAPGAGGKGKGGAIYAAGSVLSVTVSNSTFSNDAAGGSGGGGNFSGFGQGGAIATDASLAVSGSTFTSDVAGGPASGAGQFGGLGEGGAIFAAGGGFVTRSTFAGNSAGGQGNSICGSGVGLGGAILGTGSSLSVDHSTFTGNSAGGASGLGTYSGYGYGGAVSVGSEGFTCPNGGAGLLPGAITLSNDTVDGNAASQGGSGINGAANVTAKATIVSGNTGASNCDASVASSSNDLEYGSGASESSCGFDLPSADPLLGALQNNGGPTQTQALAAGSPAIDVVPRGQADCPASGQTTDQRGDRRPDQGEASCDVGAFEFQDTPVVFGPFGTTTEMSSSQNPSVAGQPVTFTATISPTPDGGTVSFTDPGTTIPGCDAVPVNTTTGQAICTTTFSTPGSYGVQAVYSGNGFYLGSQSPVITQVVNQPPPTATSLLLISSANPIVVLEQVTYTARVIPTPNGGRVRFFDNGHVIAGCAKVPVSPAGTATCPWTYSRPGAHAIRARYTGTTDYTKSTSNKVTQRVKHR